MNLIEKSLSIENFNGQFKGIFDLQGQVPTKGATNTRRYILGAVFVISSSFGIVLNTDSIYAWALSPF